MSDTPTIQRVGTADADERRALLIARVEGASPGSSADAAGVSAALATALGDADWRVRKEAVGLIRSINPEHIIPVLIAGIVQSDNVGLRNSAIEAAGVLGDSMVTELEAAFDSVSGPSRRFIVSALGMTESLDASDVLVRACGDADGNLVIAAIDALARIGGPKAESVILRHLAEADSFKRMAALDALDRLEVAVPFEDLEPVLLDPVVRRAALGVLGRSRSDAAVPILLEALSDRSSATQAMAAISLEHLGEASDDAATRIADEAQALPASVRTSMRRVLGQGDARARRAAANLLLLARDADALGDVLVIAADVSLSSASLAALSAWGSAAIAPLLAVADRTVGAVAALALEIAADLAAQGVDASTLASVHDRVCAAIAGRDELVREAAIRSLASCATLDDVDALAALVAGPRLDDSIRAGATLERLVVDDAARVARAVFAIDPAAGGGALCPAFARIGTPEAIERIVTCLASDDARARRAAIVALGEAQGAPSIESLALALADEDVDVRATAAMMLGRVRDAHGRTIGAERLQHAIDHESPIVQIAAVGALVDLGDVSAREHIAVLIRSPHPEVVATAIGALRALGHDNVTHLALEAAALGADEVVIATLRVLADREVPEDAHDFVRASLAHPEWRARLAAVEVAAVVPDGRVWLVERRKEESEELVRRSIDVALQLQLQGEPL